MTGEIRAGQPGASPPSVHKPIRNQTTRALRTVATRQCYPQDLVEDRLVACVAAPPVGIGGTRGGGSWHNHRRRGVADRGRQQSRGTRVRVADPWATVRGPSRRVVAATDAPCLCAGRGVGTRQRFGGGRAGCRGRIGARTSDGDCGRVWQRWSCWRCGPGRPVGVARGGDRRAAALDLLDTMELAGGVARIAGRVGADAVTGVADRRGSRDRL